MSLQEDIARNILRAAIDSELGIRVRIEPTSNTPSPTARAKQILYRYKQENSEYANLQIRFDSEDPDNFLMIIKTENEVKNDEEHANSSEDFDI
jgi:hypothetical protein